MSIHGEVEAILLCNIQPKKKAHPWRRCPIGEHFVREHSIRSQSSDQHSAGNIIIHEHCARNPSCKEELSYAEIQHITDTYFADLVGPPSKGLVEFENSNAYDKEIRGWTRYWNDVFEPANILPANLVKALIATESSFKPDPKTIRIARGLMQVRTKTREYLQDIHGELSDYLVRLTPEQLLEPSSNICAGIRWLFRKQVIASSKLNRDATWIETVADYKGYLDKIIASEQYNLKPMQDLEDYYNRLGLEHK